MLSVDMKASISDICESLIKPGESWYIEYYPGDMAVQVQFTRPVDNKIFYAITSLSLRRLYLEGDIYVGRVLKETLRRFRGKPKKIPKDPVKRALLGL